MSYKDKIPPEYQNTPDRPFTPWDFAETVTPESLPYLFMRLADESQNIEYQISIMGEAAKTLDRTAGGLWAEFREYQKKGDNKLERFRFLSVGDLYSKPYKTEWLVESYLDKESLAMIFGKSSTLKSFLAIDIGLCIANGTEWHGNRVGQGAVFYVCGEGQKGISRRLRAWELHHSIYIQNAPFFVSNRPAQFLNEESAIEVVAAANGLCDKHGKPTLIIIDTLNRNFGAGDEGNTADMTKFVQVVDSDFRRNFGCSVLIVHHTGHSEQERPRGAYALHAALDWEYQAVKNDMILKLTNTKAKDFDNLPPIYFKAEIMTLDGEEENGKTMTSLVLVSAADPVRRNRPLTGANKIAYDTLVECVKRNGGKPIHIDVWRKAAYESNISGSDKDDSKQKAFKRAKEDLQELGLIETKDDHWNPTPDTGHKEDI